MAPPPVHLQQNGSTIRNTTWGQSYRLTERPPSSDALEVIRWLGVEKNARYQPVPGTTYCNVYAHDYCVMRGAYLPRVWWTPAAIQQLEDGRNLAPTYNQTVVELSANGLFRWLDKWSAEYGWHRVGSLNEAQEAANRGRVVVICGRRVVEEHPGHISVVAPESERCVAVRNVGRVLLPVQSQAGAKCSELSTSTGWWLGQQFAEYGFWVYGPPISDADVTPVPSSEPPDTIPETPPAKKSSQSFRAVDAPIIDGPATPLRAGPGEHTVPLDPPKDFDK